MQFPDLSFALVVPTVPSQAAVAVRAVAPPAAHTLTHLSVVSPLLCFLQAQRFPDCILAEIYGDETPETRKMMMQMEVRVTPTFRMYRQGDCVNVTTGTNDKKLMRGILSAMTAAELAVHEQEIADTMSFDEAEQPVEAAQASS
jgi:hypothetical protein